MKKLTRLALGLSSTLLLLAGLARAADRLDPVRLNSASVNDSVNAAAPDCVGTLCNVVEETGGPSDA